MAIFQKLTDLTKGKKKPIKDGIDTGAKAVKGKAGSHADKVDSAADAAKKAADKLPD